MVVDIIDLNGTNPFMHSAHLRDMNDSTDTHEPSLPLFCRRDHHKSARVVSVCASVGTYTFRIKCRVQKVSAQVILIQT